MIKLSGQIRCNCPACLEPDVLIVKHDQSRAVLICCSGCGFSLTVPPVGPNPTLAVALELIGADEIGEKREGSRLLGVVTGEALDVIPMDSAPPPREKQNQ